MVSEVVEMRYVAPLFRPPSEADSLILQVTLGCSHNMCTFCSMYKGKPFRIKSLAEVREDIRAATAYGRSAQKVFLADGDALAMETEQLVAVLGSIRQAFPAARISLYAGPANILKKSADELRAVYEAGVSLAYFGLESGDAHVLHDIKKGVTPEEVTQAGRKIQRAGLDLSATVILGLGGKGRWREHALATAKAASAINPKFLAALTLYVAEGAPLRHKIERGEFVMLTPRECLAELKLMLEHLDVSDCLFRSNHASNYAAVGGKLPAEREKMLGVIDRVLADEKFKDERFRGL